MNVFVRFTLAIVLFNAFAYAGTKYVSPHGSHTNPFETWQTAATNIQAAVDAAGDGESVVVTNGTYNVYSPVSVFKGITLQSVQGAAATIIEGGYPGRTSRCVYVSHADAIVEGFTIRGGKAIDWVPAGYGGGVLIGTNGTVRNCIITENSGTYGAGAACLYGGTLQACTIINNSATYRSGGVMCHAGGMIDSCAIGRNDSPESAGGIYLNLGGTVRNSLIYQNVARTYGGGMYCWNSGNVENCTVVSNTAQTAKGGGVYFDRGGRVYNTIIYNNTAWEDPDFGTSSTNPVCFFCCTPDAVDGLGNITGDPILMDIIMPDLHILAGSPCIDSGTNMDWMTGAFDYEGNDRILSGRVDIGAYEFNAASFSCAFSANRREIPEGSTVTFTPYAAGPDTTITYIAWDFDNDGTPDRQGMDLETVSNTYRYAGIYSVSLTVSNASGARAFLLRPDFIKVGPLNTYVSPSGTDAYPYTNWTSAAHAIQDAVDVGVDGTTVNVADGTYVVENEITLAKGITLKSAHGSAATVIDGSNFCRCVFISHPSASIEGFTLRNGRAVSGAGVYCQKGGIVRNCRISRCYATWSGGGVFCYLGGLVKDSEIDYNYSEGSGGGVYCEQGGSISSCFIHANFAKDSWDGGGGAWLNQGGLVTRCTIVSNIANHSGGGVQIYRSGIVDSCILSSNLTGWGGGVMCKGGGTVRNSLVLLNSATISGGGVYLDDQGAAYNCTIVSNRSIVNGGGLTCWMEDYGPVCTVQNCIVYYNLSPADQNFHLENKVTPDRIDRDILFFANSCVTPLRPGFDNIDDQPLFVNPAGLNYRLTYDSLCLDGGVNMAWMNGRRDLDGIYRILCGVADMGCYEFKSEPLRCNYVADPRAGTNPCVVAFTAYACGNNPSVTQYTWDFENDGIIDIQGAGKNFVVHTYERAGIYSPALAVDNTGSEHAERVKQNYIRVAPAIAYVSLAGQNRYPYTNWAHAANAVQTGVDVGLDGTVVLVSSGRYEVTSEITISTGIIVRGVYGPAYTVIDGGFPGRTNRCFAITHTNAIVEQLTITRGANNYYGGVLCAPGLVRDCVITNNAAISWGGGIFVGNGGRVMNSIITGNRGLGSQSIGGGVFISRDGFARNCLITGNSANDGGGVCTWFGGTLENCTVSANNAPHYGGGAYVRYGGSVNNNIFYYNTSPYNNPDCYVSGSGWKCNYNQAGNAIPGYGNSTAPPGFVDQATGDYHLAAGSACIDTGSNITWMTSSFDIDGQMRVIYSTVDRGAYEYADRLWCGIRAKPLEVLVNGPVQFESLLAGTNKTSVYYWWDFDDNGSIDSQGLDKHAPVWHYSVTGTYSSVLTVSNDIGQVATSLAERYITVLPGVQADFSASPLTGVVPHIVYFTSLARNNPQYWYWDFDNDQIVDSISSNPVHIFMIEGTYTVVMTVSNNFGNGGWSMATMTKTNYIEVLPEPLTVLMLVFMAGLAGRRAHYW